MTLLADLGNTRLKLARIVPGGIERLVDFNHGEPAFATRLDAWLAAQAVAAPVWLASVAPSERTELVLAAFARHGWLVRRATTRVAALGLSTAYERFEQLGVDRWLALLALQLEDRAPCVVASVGSALTCDALAPGGRHLGGLIAPAPEAMQVALMARAPGLPRASGQVEWLARSTEAGIASGCALAAVSLIERFQRHLAEHLQQAVELVLCGGGAEPLRASLPAHQWRPDLVLEGLARWAGAHASGAAAAGVEGMNPLPFGSAGSKP